ncbi:ABC transporter permease [Streptomyces sp. NPDC002537]
MLIPSRLSPRDVVRVGGFGLRTRPVRVVLSALGIAIGIAAMVATVGISSSSRAELDRKLDALGTNLLTTEPGQSIDGSKVKLPQQAADMIRRIEKVETASAIGKVDGVKTYRNDRTPAEQSGGISAFAARPDLLKTVSAEIARGTWFNDATAKLPTTVLGAGTAKRLGVTRPGEQVWLGGRWFTVAGVLAPAPLAPELDTAALVGWESAQENLDFDGHPTTVYTRAVKTEVDAVRPLLAATANPEDPSVVAVSRPSDALAAQQAGDRAFTGLLVGLGSVALLVGGIGVANTMVISVLERHGEVGLRRSLGATQGQVCAQFLTESLLLSALGGGAGVVIGSGVTAAYALAQGWPTVVPPWVMAGGIGATLVIGGVAGLYPAVRAARLAPTAALAAT